MTRRLQICGGLAALALSLSGCLGDRDAGPDIPTLTAADFKPRPEPPAVPPAPPPPPATAETTRDAGEPQPSPPPAGPHPPPALAGRVTLGLADIQGSLERSSLGGELQARLPGLQACYQRVLAKDPALSGTLEVTFRIGRQGQVATVRLTKPGPPGALPACVLRQVAGWTFPPGGEVSVRLPLTFGLEP